MADSDDSDRFVRPWRSDAITSFVTQTQALVKAQHERDAALATLARVRALCDSNPNATRDGYLLVATIRKAIEGTS